MLFKKEQQKKKRELKVISLKFRVFFLLFSENIKNIGKNPD